MGKTSPLWTLLLVGAAGGLVVWLLTRLSRRDGGGLGGLGGYGIAGSQIHHSNVWMGGPAPAAPWGGTVPWSPVQDTMTSSPQPPRTDALGHDPPLRLNFSRNDRRLPKMSGRTPLPTFAVQGVTRTDGKTIGTTPQLLVPRRDVDVAVTVTNASGANTVRVGPEADVSSGGGMPIPPNGVVPLPLRAGQDLWVVATGSTLVGVNVSER